MPASAVASHPWNLVPRQPEIDNRANADRILCLGPIMTTSPSRVEKLSTFVPSGFNIRLCFSFLCNLQDLTPPPHFLHFGIFVREPLSTSGELTGHRPDFSGQAGQLARGGSFSIRDVD